MRCLQITIKHTLDKEKTESQTQSSQTKTKLYERSGLALRRKEKTQRGIKNPSNPKSIRIKRTKTKTKKDPQIQFRSTTKPTKSRQELNGSDQKPHQIIQKHLQRPNPRSRTLFRRPTNKTCDQNPIVDGPEESAIEEQDR